MRSHLSVCLAILLVIASLAPSVLAQLAVTYSTIAKTGMVMPGSGTHRFTNFADPVIRDGRCVFVGSGSDPVTGQTSGGVYLHDGAALQRLVGTSTAIPVGNGNFIFFYDPFPAGGNVVFCG